MKLTDRIFVSWIREKVDVSRMITGVVFIVRQVQEQYQGKKRKLYFVAVNLEKPVDRVPGR